MGPHKNISVVFHANELILGFKSNLIFTTSFSGFIVSYVKSEADLCAY